MARPKIGAYVRVSTADGKQDTASQRHAIREWAKANHVPASEIRWYEDRLSGKTMDRPKLLRLLRAIERGDLDTLVVFRLDRLARSTRDGLQILADVAEKGTRVVSVSESIDFSNSTGRLIASILLSVAAFEREVTVERIRAGMDAAKANGTHCGRPRDEKRLQQIRMMRQTMSAQAIADKLKISRQAVYSALSRGEGITSAQQ
jgi:DNA invertase Pin-like site-specific DNA recombinase